MSEGLGWLPVEARETLEQEQARKRADEVERLLALDPRARLLALMERAACRSLEDQVQPTLTAEDLARLVESFPGAAPLGAAELAERFPAMLEE